MSIPYTPLPWDQRLLCPSCHRVRMQLWTLPFDRVWHCNGCKNTIIADQKVLDWAELVGTTIRCRCGLRNTAEDREDPISIADVISVRGNEVEIKKKYNAFATWYTIHDTHLGYGGYYEGGHLVKVV